MDSRISVNPDKLFEAFLEVEAPVNDETATILKTFPDQCDQDTLKQAPWFCYACRPEKGAVQHFSFVLTDGDGKFRFGYCRYPPDASLCLCFVSALPWFDFFYNILDKVAELRMDGQGELVVPLLKALMNNPMPTAGERLVVIPEGLQSGQAFSFQTPDPQKLSSIPESNNLTEYITNIDPVYILHLFAAMLFERRIIITSSKLSLVSACVHGAASLLYPLNWQHIFVPIMPARLVDYCCAPMPFLVGVHSSVMAKIRKMPLDEVVVLDADANQLEIYHDDLGLIPSDVVNPLKDILKKHTSALDETVAKAFLDAFVYLIGGYRDALRFREGEQIKFDAMAFIESRPKQMQPFLQKVLHLQQFQQFMMERLHRLNQGQGLRDLFENAITSSSQDSNNYLNKYALWVKSKTKRGISEISSITATQVLPSMKTAFSHIHSRTKKGVKGLKQLMNDDKYPQQSGMTIGSPQLESKTSLSVHDLLSSLPADSTIRREVQSQQMRAKKPPPLVRPYSEYRATKTTSIGSGGDVLTQGNLSAPLDSPLSLESDLFNDVGERQSAEAKSAMSAFSSTVPIKTDNESDDSQATVESPAVDDLLGLSVSIPSRSHVTCLARELFLNFDPASEVASPMASPLKPPPSATTISSFGETSILAESQGPSIGEAMSPASTFDPFHSPSHASHASFPAVGGSSGNMSDTSPKGRGRPMFPASCAVPTSVPSRTTSQPVDNSMDDFSELARERTSSLAQSASAYYPVTAAARSKDPWRADHQHQANGGGGSNPLNRQSFTQRSSAAGVARSSVAADGGRAHAHGPGGGFGSASVSRAPQFNAMARVSSSASIAPAPGPSKPERVAPTPFDDLLGDSSAVPSPTPARPRTSSIIRTSARSDNMDPFSPVLHSSLEQQSSRPDRPGPPIKPYRKPSQRGSPSSAGSPIVDQDLARPELEFDPLRL